jgi:hypothetical protein
MGFEQLKRSAAIICKQVSYPERPILHATRDFPVEPADSGWQFVCGVENHDDFGGGQTWTLEEVTALDPTLRAILDAEPKISFERRTVDTPWRRVRYANERQEL